MRQPPYDGVSLFSPRERAKIVEPLTRAFTDHRRKRPVIYRLARYWGAGVHYYASLEEEHNAILVEDPDDPGRRIWAKLHPDEEGQGRRLSEKFSTVTRANGWALRTFREEFGTRSHRLVRFTGSTTRWWYREGDL